MEPECIVMVDICGPFPKYRGICSISKIQILFYWVGRYEKESTDSNSDGFSDADKF